MIEHGATVDIVDDARQVAARCRARQDRRPAGAERETVAEIVRNANGARPGAFPSSGKLPSPALHARPGVPCPRHDHAVVGDWGIGDGNVLRSVVACVVSGLAVQPVVRRRRITPAPAFNIERCWRRRARAGSRTAATSTTSAIRRSTQINRDNVGKLKGVWRTHLRGSGVGPQYSGPSAAARLRRRALHRHRRERRVRASTSTPARSSGATRANLDPQARRLLRLDEPRRRASATARSSSASSTRKLVALDQRTGKVVWDDRKPSDRRKASAITSAPLYYDGMVITGFAGGDRGMRGRVQSVRRRRRQAASGRSTRSPAPASSATTPGRRTTTSGSTAARRSGRRRRVDPELGLIYFSTGNAGPDLQRLRCAPATICSRRRWSRSRRRPANTAGTSSRCITTSGTTTRRIPVILFDARVDGKPRKGIAQIRRPVCYILDRETGEPLFGIEDAGAAGAAPARRRRRSRYPRGDTFVPHEIDIAPEGSTLVNAGRIFTPFWSTSPCCAGRSRGANWPPSSYDPETHTDVRLRDRSDRRARGDRREAAPDYMPTRPPVLRPHGRRAAAASCRPSTCARTSSSWQQQWADAATAARPSTAGGLVFVGRNDGRSRRSTKRHGEQLWEFQTGAGIHCAPTAFEHDGQQYVVAFAGGSVFGSASRRQRVAVLAERHDRS